MEAIPLRRFLQDIQPVLLLLQLYLPWNKEKLLIPIISYTAATLIGLSRGTENKTLGNRCTCGCSFRIFKR
jgi:hypothetical protein